MRGLRRVTQNDGSVRAFTGNVDRCSVPQVDPPTRGVTTISVCSPAVQCSRVSPDPSPPVVMTR
jgi:hypothetical protein